jgi:hypothetical protein
MNRMRRATATRERMAKGDNNRPVKLSLVLSLSIFGLSISSQNNFRAPRR